MIQGLPNQLNSDQSRIRSAREWGGDGLRPLLTAPPRRDETSADKATSAFVRRTLCAHQIQATSDKARNTPKPIEELLPPLTSSNEVDLELYAFIAIIIKEFVYPWYTKITPDHVFTDQIIHVIAHCSRALEQRSRRVDFEALLLNDLPKLVDDHISGKP